MQDRYAQVVHEVIGYGLDLKARLVRGETQVMQREQDRFRQMLTSRSDLNQDPTYVGDTINMSRISITTSRAMEPFLGVKYALTCWIDELFIAPDSPWSAAWEAQSMEVFFYGGANDRGWRFWENALKAEARPGTDALEVYLWCVLLGFRGEAPPNRIASVPRWIDTTRSRIITGMPREFALPTEREAPTDVPPLESDERYGFTLRLFFFLLILVVFLVVVMVLKQINSGA